MVKQTRIYLARWKPGSSSSFFINEVSVIESGLPRLDQFRLSVEYGYQLINVICGKIINCQIIVLGHVYFYRFTFIIGKMFVIDCWLHFTSACFYRIYSFIVKCTAEHESLFRNCRTPSIARCLNNSLLFARLCLIIY